MLGRNTAYNQKGRVDCQPSDCQPLSGQTTVVLQLLYMGRDKDLAFVLDTLSNTFTLLKSLDPILQQEVLHISQLHLGMKFVWSVAGSSWLIRQYKWHLRWLTYLVFRPGLWLFCPHGYWMGTHRQSANTVFISSFRWKYDL